MKTPLEKIEGQHIVVFQKRHPMLPKGAAPDVQKMCVRCDMPYPCHVVKLAQALDATLYSLEALYTTLGPSKSTWIHNVVATSKARTNHVNAKGVMNDVAGIVPCLRCGRDLKEGGHCCECSKNRCSECEGE